MVAHSRQIVIVGAGIGGLTLALALHARGLEVSIVEAAPELRPLGVGINLLPHAMKELTELGLLDKLLALGIETEALKFFNKFGQEIWSEPRGRSAGYEWPQVSIHRGELQMALLDTTLERLGDTAVQLDAKAMAVGYDEQRAELTVRSSNGEEQRINASVVVGADGIHSTIRQQFYPDEGMPLWNGAILWRGLMETEQFLGGRTMFMAGHMAQKFVCYPVDQETYLNGRSMTNWIAELRYPITELAAREDWNKPGDFEQFLPKFEQWRFPWLDVCGIIERADVCYEFPMVDRDPLPQWRHGCVTLLGDAAHPMYPVGSNGASQAILDARCLADALVDAPTTIQALDRYESQRRPATAAIVRANRGNGPEQVMQLAEERAPNGFEDIDSVVPLAERQRIADQYKQTAGFSKEALKGDR